MAGGPPPYEPAQDHSHTHGHSHAHLAMPGATPSPESVRDLLRAPKDELLQGVLTLVRVGRFEALQPLLTGLQDADQTSWLHQLDADGHTLLHWAAKRTDDLRILQLLLELTQSKTTTTTLLVNTPSEDSVGMYPLHWAATEKSIPHIAVLLQNGAQLESKDKSGCTPLLIAAQYGQVQVVAYLLQKGANSQAVDNSWDTALHWAAYKGSIQVCGLLTFQNTLSWDRQDTYGQTPLHLAALRGHTSVVRYILLHPKHKAWLQLQDKNGRTPLDLAIHKKRPTVEAVLRQAMRRNQGEAIVHGLRQLCRLHSWKVWLGCTSSGMDEVDESPSFPLYVVLASYLIHLGLYYGVYCPIWNTSRGILWDWSGWHVWNFITMLVNWVCFYKVWTTNPGLLNDKFPGIDKWRRKYEETLESLADESQLGKSSETQLCHTCHIARPLRSKHCRVARCCVLMFDHHCPFVGNTIGLYNHKWFYLTLLFQSIGLLQLLGTYLLFWHRSDSTNLVILGLTIWMAILIFPAAGMLVYHTQLLLVNLTTNEHHNMRRYPYLWEQQGNTRSRHYKNPWFRGYLQNCLARFSPSAALYELDPEREGFLSSRSDAV